VTQQRLAETATAGEIQVLLENHGIGLQAGQRTRGFGVQACGIKERRVHVGNKLEVIRSGVRHKLVKIKAIENRGEVVVVKVGGPVLEHSLDFFF